MGVGTIRNDDGPLPLPPVITIDDVAHDAGDSGTTPLVFTVTRSSGAGTTSVKCWTAYGFNASSSDLTLKSGTLSFAAGGLTKTITIW